MTLTSCVAIISSFVALGFFIFGITLTLKTIQVTFNDSVKIKNVISLSITSLLTSIFLLYSVTYFTRNLDTGESTFLGIALTYENCGTTSRSAFVSEDDDEEDDEEEIAFSSVKFCASKNRGWI
jgi:hypothetical protein